MLKLESSGEVPPNAYVSWCPSREIVSRLAEKWTMLALTSLMDGPMRFGALRRQIEGVSQKMLTKTLRNLEQDGLITRTVYDEMPLRVEYNLTPLGQELAPLILSIKDWAEHNMAKILTHRDSHDLGQERTLAQE